jgi:hypothetical protein
MRGQPCCGCEGQPLHTLYAGAGSAGRAQEQGAIPYVQPTLKAVFLDAIAPASFLEFLKLGIPGGLMMQLEGNSYDITNVLASLLGATPIPLQKDQGEPEWAHAVLGIWKRVRIPVPRLQTLSRRPCAKCRHAQYGLEYCRSQMYHPSMLLSMCSFRIRY